MRLVRRRAQHPLQGGHRTKKKSRLELRGSPPRIGAVSAGGMWLAEAFAHLTPPSLTDSYAIQIPSERRRGAGKSTWMDRTLS